MLDQSLQKHLKLTEEQAIKIKPILEESFTELAAMVRHLAEKGTSSLEDFRTQYDELVKNLREQLQSLLDKDQMDTLDNHSEELKEKIQENAIAI